jgi:crotonobetainyl-CoA:carnitine CoA-transferase CaiB-like acyl-CoA transferase
MTDAEKPLPLSGIKVVDFTHVIAGPYATQMLGDLGASVTKIEEITRGDAGRTLGPFVAGQSHYFLAFNRNKRSIAVDLKTDDGKAIAKRIISQADVLVENFAPAAMGRLGFGYDEVVKFNPDIIYCSISGFGQTGPLSSKGYYDLVGQAYAGVMSTNGEADAPPLKVGIPVGDTSGSYFGVINILAALLARKETGKGRFIDLSLYDCLLAGLANYGGYYLSTGSQPARTGSKHYFSVPYAPFPASDGYVVIGVFMDAQWQAFCQAMDLPSAGADERFFTAAGRSAHRETVEKIVIDRLKSLTVDEVINRLESVRIPCGPVNDIAAALNHPHIQQRNVVRTMHHESYGDVRAIFPPLGEMQRDDASPPPLLGEHGIEILAESGFDSGDIERLIASGVVAVSRS